MEFRIRHEKLSAVIMIILLFVLIAGLTMALIIMDLPEQYWLWGFVLQFVVIIVFAVVQSTSTVITIEDGTVQIRHLFAKRMFHIAEISDLQISHYKRWHKNHYIEQRMRLTIRFGDKKDVVLNDTAMVHTPVFGILATRNDVLPDEDVTLYQVYQIIQSQMH
ncbi:MAG: hypothetical protein PUC41_07350 [Oscillospiraceae bacterium]|nr:hypothetical protein [Oscillospiraceae bacterium]